MLLHARYIHVTCGLEKLCPHTAKERTNNTKSIRFGVCTSEKNPYICTIFKYEQ